MFKQYLLVNNVKVYRRKMKLGVIVEELATQWIVEPKGPTQGLEVTCSQRGDIFALPGLRNSE